MCSLFCDAMRGDAMHCVGTAMLESEMRSAANCFFPKPEFRRGRALCSSEE